MATATARKRTRPAGAPGAPAPLPTRELILDTAERLFAARGLDGVAVRDLAAELGITASSLYNHFPSKQSLYAAVLERGLKPIVEMIGASWHDRLQPDRVHATVDGLTTHLARHPHLAGLLQRALMEDAGNVPSSVGDWVEPLYREGVTVLRRAARDAGWGADEVPYLGVALFGMIFAYFINAPALRRFAFWSEDPHSERALAQQRRFLEQALIRLLGPRPRGVPAKRTRRTSDV